MLGPTFMPLFNILLFQGQLILPGRSSHPAHCIFFYVYSCLCVREYACMACGRGQAEEVCPFFPLCGSRQAPLTHCAILLTLYPSLLSWDSVDSSKVTPPTPLSWRLAMSLLWPMTWSREADALSWCQPWEVFACP